MTGSLLNTVRRTIEIIDLLRQDHYSVPCLARKYDCSQKTIYRCILMLEEMGYPIEKDFQNRYFIVTLELV